MKILAAFFISAFCAFGQSNHAQLLLGLVDQPATPSDSPGGGTYGSTQSVTLSDATAQFILYTINGSTPACPATGTLYTGAISVAVTTTIKAIGCNGITGGGVLTSTYTISAGNTWTTTPVINTGSPVNSTGTTTTTTGLSTPASGDLITYVCAEGQSANSIASFATGGSNVTVDGNGWRQAVNSSTNRGAQIWYAVAAGAGTQIVSNWTNTISLNTACNIATWHSSGTITSASTLDVQNSSTNASATTGLSGTVTATAGDVCVAGIRTGNSPSGPGNSYTALATNNAQILFAYLVPASGSTSTSWTFSAASYDGVIACFKP